MKIIMALINQVKLLISLAQIDGTVADREKNFIVNIARANGLKEIELDPLFEERHPLIIPNDLDEEEKFNYLINLVQLMKIDDRLYKEELMFCAKIASSLGYNREVMFELMLHVNSASMAKDEIESLKTLTRKYRS
jgi:hypothetical protein